MKIKMMKLKECKKNMQTREIVFLVVPILLFAVFLGCSYIDIGASREQTLLNCAIQNKFYLNLFAKDSITEEASNQEEEELLLIRQIEENFPTTSTTFMIVMREDFPVFIRDTTLTKKIRLQDIDERNKLQVKKKKCLSRNIENLYDVVLNNDDEYIISYCDIKTKNGTLLVGICNEKHYLEKKYFFNLLYTHIIFYLVIFTIIMIAIITILIYKKSEIHAEKEHWKTSFSLSRKKMDLLELQILERPKYYTKKITSGFNTKQLMNEIVNRLTDVQKKKSVYINLSVGDAAIETYLNLVACLEKKKLDNMVCCVDEDSSFNIIILNCESEIAERYIRELFLFYEQYFGVLNNSVNYSIKSIEEAKQCM